MTKSMTIGWLLQRSCRRFVEREQKAAIGLGASVWFGSAATFWIAVPTICYDYWDTTRDAKNDLFDECDDANVDFSEAVKNLR